jgi:hypothetical protein
MVNSLRLYPGLMVRSGWKAVVPRVAAQTEWTGVVQGDFYLPTPDRPPAKHRPKPPNLADGAAAAARKEVVRILYTSVTTSRSRQRYRIDFAQFQHVAQPLRLIVSMPLDKAKTP